MTSSRPPTVGSVDGGDPPSSSAPTSATSAASTDSADHALLLAACRKVLAPLARLAVERGVAYPLIDELLRGAFVDAARAAYPQRAAQRGTSRLSAATGLTRREITRLLQPGGPAEARRRSPATELFTRWLTAPQWRGDAGAPGPLPRQGPAPSFESLAQTVTRDVHPRTLLEELLRLGLVEVDETADTVRLLRETFVPSGNEARLFEFLGANVGDHLSASVANVLSPARPHLEQALFADELSAVSIDRLRPFIAAQWKVLVRDLAPQVQKLIDADRAAGRTPDQRLRVGLYTYAEAAPALPDHDPDPDPTPVTARHRPLNPEP